ncbi:MAG: nucleotidyltransferase family protein, partial [Candidatus Heimdallarchaeota archaeon]|nr:nucleotidyltransferase family protein [Candidatus Heimdallarchaeota archaeon]
MQKFNVSRMNSLLCSFLTVKISEQRFALAIHLMEDYGDEQVFAQAQANDITPILAHSFEGIDEIKLSMQWHRVHSSTYHQITAYLAELDLVAKKLADSNILIVALKNGGIARGIYSCPGCCPMGDLDILVERRHFHRVHQFLLELGFYFEFRSPLGESELQVAENGGG